MGECAVALRRGIYSGQGIFRLVVAGGGTGGHCNPAVAVIEELRRLTSLEVLWIGTGRDAEMRAIKGINCKHKRLDVLPLQGVDFLKKLKAVAGIPSTILQAVMSLMRFRPHVVLGVGSYVSGPVIVASWMTGIPCVIQEQNVIPGTANRMSARFANKIFVSFEESVKYFPKSCCVVTGNPVRHDLLDISVKRRSRTGDVPVLLIVGGSQGASEINKKGVEAVIDLWKQGEVLKVVHQTGSRDFNTVKETYSKAAVEQNCLDMFEVHEYIDDMASAYSQADLVLCRAGATTIAELTAIGLPSILIPFPHATGAHQSFNADLLVKRGAAVMLDMGPLCLATQIKEIIFDSARLDAMSDAALSLGRPNAAVDIAKCLIDIGRRSEVTA